MSAEAGKPTHARGWAFSVAVAVVAALSVARYVPHMLSFAGTVFGDPGWPLAVDALLDDGLVPTRDFGYFYGLLALPIDRAWFALVGRTPMAVVTLTILGAALLTVGVIRFGLIAVDGFWPRALLVAAVPVAVMPLQYPTPLHAIEAALLVNALAFQARGRYAVALALVTVAVFIKPGLAYFHGLAVVLLVLGGYGPTAWRDRLRAIVPAAVVLGVVGGGLAAWFGVGPLLDTQFPFRAVRTYQDDNYGFFRGVGSEFWKPIGNPVTRYVLFPAGFWLLATGWLVVGAILRVRRLRDPRAATVVTCAFLHVAFVVLLFGNEWSWLYYSAILVCGCCAVVGDPSAPGQAERAWVAPVLLGVLALSGQVLQTVYAVKVPVEKWERSPTTGGLFAEPADVAGWEKIRETARRDGVMVFGHSGGAFVVFPEVDSPRVWFLLRSTMTPVEADRVRAQLRAANWLVVSNAVQYSHPGDWPEFRDEFAQFQEVERTPSYRLLGRVRP
jgi:hypothetical protein